jgi:hypothetical protein
LGEVSGVPYRNAPNIVGKSYAITADVEIPPMGADGMLNTLGGRFGRIDYEYCYKIKKTQPNHRRAREYADARILKGRSSGARGRPILKKVRMTGPVIGGT